MVNITIPPEALEAAARVLCKADGLVPDRMRSDGKPTWMLWDDTARAACLAMLEAWPGMELDETMWSGGTNFIVLPLTENTNDKA